MKKGITIFIIFSFVTLFTANSFAQPRQRMMRGRAMMNRSHTGILTVLKAKQEELKVTDDQINAIKDLVFSFEEEMIQAKGKGSSQHLELRKLLQDRENLDYEKIRAALSKASDIRQDTFIDRLKLRDEILNVLTPEQHEALKALQKDQARGRRGFQREGMRGFHREGMRGFHRDGLRMQRFNQLRKHKK